MISGRSSNPYFHSWKFPKIIITPLEITDDWAVGKKQAIRPRPTSTTYRLQSHCDCVFIDQIPKYPTMLNYIDNPWIARGQYLVGYTAWTRADLTCCQKFRHHILAIRNNPALSGSTTSSRVNRQKLRLGPKFWISPQSTSQILKIFYHCSFAWTD